MNPTNCFLAQALPGEELIPFIQVLFASGIALGLGGSTVLEMINAGTTDSKSLESAWKAWNKSRGEFRQGLANRREDEWELYSKGDYLRNH